MLHGALDVYTSGGLRASLLELVEAGALALVVDLAGVEFVDSAGFSALLAGVRRAQARGGGLALVTADDSVVRMLRIMGLRDVMPVFASAEEAWASFETV